jgi:hypothetical protein
MGINFLAIIVAVIVAFVASMIWYIMFDKTLAKLNPKAYGDMKKPEPRKMLLELIRNIIFALVLQYLLVHMSVVDIMGAISIGLLLWLGFPFILLTGSILHEKTPTKLAAIHAGDWLLKILFMIVILTLWK